MTKHCAFSSRDSSSSPISKWQRLYSSSSVRHSHSTIGKLAIEDNDEIGGAHNDLCARYLEIKGGGLNEVDTTTFDSTTLDPWFQTVQSHEDRIAQMRMPDGDHDLASMTYSGQNFDCPDISLSHPSFSQRGGGDRMSTHLINAEEKKADNVLEELEKILNEHDPERDDGLGQESLERIRTVDEGISSLLGVGRKESLDDNMNLHPFSSFPFGRNQEDLLQGEGSILSFAHMHAMKVSNFERRNSYKRVGQKYLTIWHQYSRQISLCRETIIQNWTNKKISLLLTSWKNYSRIGKTRYKELLLKNGLRVLGRTFCCWNEVVEFQSEKTKVNFCRGVAELRTLHV